MNKLSKRQQYLLSCIAKTEVICDVGCDHGKIGLECLKTNLANKVIFVDISQLCLNKAINNVNKALMIDKSQFVCQDGLHNIEADCAIIAGMGGKEIIDILVNTVNKPSKLVLQPMKNVSSLREYLINYYEITNDTIIYDGKYYNFICASLGSDKYSELEMKYGRSNLINMGSDFIKYLQLLLNRNIKIYNVTKDNKHMQEIQQISELLSKTN